MSSEVSGGVVDMGKLYVHIAENGHTFELECDEYTLVETVQKFLESVTGIHLNDQLLLCLDMKLDSQRPLSAYKLPSVEREVFLFNRARMRSNSPPPAPEQVESIDIPDPLMPSLSSDPPPLDDATDPALKALPAYERQFRFHFQQGHAIFSRTLAKFDICNRLFRELKVQERALDVARGNLDHFYGIINQNYKEFMRHYSQQHRSHSNLLINFGRYIDRLRSCKLMPALQTANRKCLLDFLKEEHLRRLAEDFNGSHKQFENKVSEFKQEFAELERNAEHLFSSEASFVKGLELTIKDHQKCMTEQKSIMQTLSKDVDTVRKLVDDCVSNQFSSSLRPHDAVSALGPMYEGHDKTYLPKIQTCDNAISDLVDYCRGKKDEMNIFVHTYMQRIAYIQYMIKDVHYKFSVFQEALKRQNDQFEQLKVVRGIAPAYRACLAEVVRRKAAMKLFMGMAGQLAERLATKREAEVRRREEFIKVHGLYIPRDILASMGLYDNPSQCDVNIAPFDTNLLNIDMSDVDRYAPETLLGHSFRIEKQASLKGSVSISNDSSQSAEVPESGVDFQEKYSSEELLEGLELVEIAGTSKIEVENARLKAELASKIALLCSMCHESDYESVDDSKIDSLMKQTAEKTAEALHLKEEYEKHLHSMLKVKQMQCESYEKRIDELEQRLADQYELKEKVSTNDVPELALSADKADDDKSEILGVGEGQMQQGQHESMDEVSCASCLLIAKSGDLSKQGKTRGGLDDNMSDSSGMLNPQLDSSMSDPHPDEGQLCYKDKKDTPLADGEVALATSSMAVSISQPPNASHSETDADPGLDQKVLELQNSLAEKSNQANEAESKVKALAEESARIECELETSRKLLDESQMNCAHLENCLHEARKEAQTHLCAADRRAKQYNAVRASAVKMRGLIERLRNSMSSGAVAGLAESLRSLVQSLATSINENEDDAAAEFVQCIHLLADRVGVLARHLTELLEGHSKAKTAKEQLMKELEDKKELLSTLYKKLQLEKLANKEKISFGRLSLHEIAAFVLNPAGHYEAINRNYPHYYLSAESVALFADHLPNRPTYIIGQIVHIERQVVRSPPPPPSPQTPPSPSTSTDQHLLTSGAVGPTGLASPNPYGLPVDCEFFIVTVAMLPDTTPPLHSPSPSPS